MLLSLSKKIPPVFALLLLFSSACGEIPRPFKPDDKYNRPASSLQLIDKTGIAVQRTTKLPEQESKSLTKALVTSLLEFGIIASADSTNQGSLILKSNKKDKKIYFRLYNSNGKMILSIIQDYVFSGQDLRRRDAIAQNVARFIHKKLSSAGRDELIILHIIPVSGQPKKITSHLSRAIGKSLISRGFAITDQLVKADYLIAGSIYANNGKSSLKHIVIEWTVMKNDGFRLGTVTQENWLKPIDFNNSAKLISRNVAKKALPAIISIINSSNKKEK